MTYQMPSQTPTASTSHKGPRPPKRIRRIKQVSDLARIAELSGITIKQAWVVRETVVRMLREAVLRREDVRIAKFGKFTYYLAKGQYNCYHPDGYYFNLKGGWRIRFTPYAALDYLINPQEYADADNQPSDKADGN